MEEWVPVALVGRLLIADLMMSERRRRWRGTSRCGKVEGMMRIAACIVLERNASFGQGAMARARFLMF